MMGGHDASQRHFDVAVIGFGPAGVMATSLLAKAGLSVLAVDRSREVYDKPRAIALDHEIMRVFQDLGVVEAVSPHVAPFPASEHFGVDGSLIRRIDAVPPPFPLGYTPTLVFTQPAVEAVLRRHAATYPSAEIRLGTECLALSQTAEAVTLSLRGEGAPYAVTADYVIACDGAVSATRRALGIELADLDFDEPWLVVDVLVKESGLAKLPATAAQYCDPRRPSTFIIGPGNHRRWEIMLLPGEDPRRMEAEDEVWRLLARWLTPEDARIWRAASYRFHALVAREWRSGRVFLAGDAAHQQPPFIGQGMCQGIRDVANLSWKLEAVLKGRAGAGLLDSYGAERAAHVTELTTRIKEIGRVICELDPTAARARDARLLEEGGGRARTTTRQEIVPPLRAGLLSRRPHPANGTLFPQPWIKRPGGAVLMDTLTGTGWRLVVDRRKAGSIAFDASPRGEAVTVVPVLPPASAEGSGFVERDGVLARWFDAHDCTAALVRPDNYVFGVAPEPEAIAALAEELAEGLQ